MNDIQALANLINNAIIATWLNGDREGAKAKVSFVPDKSPFGDQARQYGYTIFNVTAKSESLAVNFPSCMFIVLPTSEAKKILQEISKSRKATIENMLNMEQMEREKVKYHKQTGGDFTPDLRAGGIDVPGVPDVQDSPIHHILDQ